MIDRFRRFEHLELSGLTQINLISGRNNAGKTAVLEALLMHAGGPHAAEIALNILTPLRTGAPAQMDPNGIITPWSSFFFSQDVGHSIRLTGKLNDEIIIVTLEVPQSERRAIFQSYAQPGQNNFTSSIIVKLRRDSAKQAVYTQTASQSTAPSILGPIQVLNAPLNLQLNPTADLLSLFVFFSGRTRTNGSELARRYSNLKLTGKDRIFVEALQTIDSRVRDVEVLVSNGAPIIHVHVGSQILPLAIFGEGANVIADLMTGIFEAQNGIALIDEIENGFHYSVLSKVWRHIGAAASQANCQIFATTHSRECLAAAGIAFRSNPSVLSLMRIIENQDEPSTPTVMSYDSSTLESALDLQLDVR